MVAGGVELMWNGGCAPVLSVMEHPKEKGFLRTSTYGPELSCSSTAGAVMHSACSALYIGHLMSGESSCLKSISTGIQWFK